MAASHKIRRAVIDLRYPNEETAFRVRSKLEDVFIDQIVPVCEEVFDAFGEETVRIERLEIDLGHIDPERLDLDHIRRALQAQLDQRAAVASGEAVEARGVPLFMEVFERFLETGSLPWFAPVSTLNALEEAFLSIPEPHQLSRSLRALLDRPTVRRRLIHQFRPTLTEHIVDLLLPAHAAAIRNEVTSKRADLSEREAAAISLEAAVALTASSDQDVGAAVRSVMEAGPAGENLKQASVAPPEEAAVSAEPLYVRLAGIVLLHPFLERFFGAIGQLGEDGAFPTVEARERAVHVLHFVATGEERPEEHELTLLKLICGLPTSFPAAREIDLTAAERREADALLRAVIEHWTRLKNTSPEGLRKAFFQREAKLEREGRAWRLTVEQHPVDVLLSTLPWSIGLVRLPWMATPMWVNWA